MIIGITGGIGSGKSTAAKIMEELGAKVILADQIAREVVKPGLRAYDQIVEVFGNDILEENRSINRKKLGDIVFNNTKLLQKLNDITHGAVADKINDKLEKMEKQGVKLTVIEAVIPVRKGFLELVDTVWVVIASESVRIHRIMARNGFTMEQAQQRIRAQMPDTLYQSIANHVLYNDGTVLELKHKIMEVLKNENYSLS